MRRRTVWLVLLACAVPRLAAVAVFRHPQDTLYAMVAGNLIGGRGYTLYGDAATYLEPLYPAVLAAGGVAAGSAGMVALQVAIACLGGLALFAVARDRGGERTAWIATALYAVSPYLARQAAALMEITVATTLAVVAVWSVDRARTPGRAALAGLVLAALLLTRFSFLPIALAALIVIALRTGTGVAAVATATLAAAIAPWLLYSRAVSGDYLPQRMGENLFVTTSAWGEGIVPRVNTDVLQPAAHDLAFAALGRDATTAERDRFLLRQALDYARAHPLRVALLKLRNLASIAQPRLLPFTELRGRAVVVDGVVRIPPQASRPLLFEIAGAAFQTLLIAGGAAGAWKRRYHLLADDAMLTIVALAVVAINVAFFPTSRLLAPMSVVPMIYTAVAVAG